MRAGWLLRSVYIAAGTVVIAAAVLSSTTRHLQFLPLILGALLLVQGFTGA